MQQEGEPAPQAAADDVTALRCWNLLANGSGGIDFAGLPLAIEWLGITDVEGLLDRLSTIRTYKPPAPGSRPGGETEN